MATPYTLYLVVPTAIGRESAEATKPTNAGPTAETVAVLTPAGARYDEPEPLIVIFAPQQMLKPTDIAMTPHDTMTLIRRLVVEDLGNPSPSCRVYRVS